MGFDENRFEGEVDDDFRCSICRDIVEDPIASKCEHVFCKPCIYEWLQRESSCPVDRKSLNNSELCEPSRFFRNFYSKLILKCEFESNGCQNSCKIEELNSHQNKCKFNPIVKNVCEKGCDALMNSSEAKNHNCVQYLKDINNKLKQDLEKANKREAENEELIRDLQILLSTQSDEINELKQKINSQSSISSGRISTFGEIERVTSGLRLGTVSSPEQKKLVESLKRKGTVKTLTVEKALLAVDRKLFCSIDPYSDGAKSIGFGTTISAPHFHGYILELLESHIKTANSVLDIGSGSGYLTICMAQMMGTTGRVIGIDHVKELIDRSEENLKKNFPHLSNKVKFVKKDGRKGNLFGSTYDVINIGGAVTEVPKRVLDQLKTGGRLIAPVGPMNDTQELVTIDKLEDGSFKRVVHLNVILGSLKSLEEQLRK